MRSRAVRCALRAADSPRTVGGDDNGRLTVQDHPVNEVSLRRMRRADLPTLATWLREEHVQRWWKDPSAPDQVEEKYLPRIDGLEPTEMLIILWGGREIGMIQCYRMRDHPDWEHALESSTGLIFGAARGIDYAIGVPDLVGRGIGSAAVAAFSAQVFARYPEIDQIVVTPQQANRASCRVLEKAGYTLKWTGILDSDDPADAGIAALYVLDRAPRTI